jgi:hypothetical protein
METERKEQMFTRILTRRGPESSAFDLQKTF